MHQSIPTVPIPDPRELGFKHKLLNLQNSMLSTRLDLNEGKTTYRLVIRGMTVQLHSTIVSELSELKKLNSMFGK